MKGKGHTGSLEVYSRTVKAGTRQYYIDAKVDRQGNRYLVLSETKLSQNTKERHRIFVYEEDLDKFVEALADVQEHLFAYDPALHGGSARRRRSEFSGQGVLQMDLEELNFED